MSSNQVIMERKDKFFMELALEEAYKAYEENNVPVGAVIVKDNKVISRNRNRVNLDKSDIAHAEMLAILEVQAELYQIEKTFTIYTTLEPCMMCLGAIIYAQFARLVVAAPAPKVGSLHFLQINSTYKERAPDIEIGVLKEESRNLLKEYVKKTGLRKDLIE